MITEILSRLLAVLVVAGFALLLSNGRVPFVPRGRWTVAVVFAAGLGMCTLAGIRDGVGTGLSQPDWLASVFAALGIAAMATLLAVLLGMSWHVGVGLLGVLIGANWFLAFGSAIATGSDTVLSGVVTLVVGAAIWIGIDRFPVGSKLSPSAA